MKNSIIDQRLFTKAMRAYRHHCQISGKPFVSRSQQFSSTDGDTVYLCFSQSDYPIQYSIMSDTIVASI